LGNAVVLTEGLWTRLGPNGDRPAGEAIVSSSEVAAQLLCHYSRTRLVPIPTAPRATSAIGKSICEELESALLERVRTAEQYELGNDRMPGTLATAFARWMTVGGANAGASQLADVHLVQTLATTAGDLPSVLLGAQLPLQRRQQIIPPLLLMNNMLMNNK
jgi:hypothetical protein